MELSCSACSKEAVEAVSVQDLKPKTYSLSEEHAQKLRSAQSHLPDKIQLYDVSLKTAARLQHTFVQHFFRMRQAINRSLLRDIL